MPGGKQEQKSLVKFGKFLAVALAVALMWGILMIFAGFMIRFRFGMLLNSLTEDISKDVNIENAVNTQGQNIAPTGEIDDDYSLGSWTKILGALIISSGVLIALFAVLGIYSGLRHNKLLLIVTVVILIVDAFVMLGIISVIASTDAGFHNNAKDELVAMIKNDYTVETVDDNFVLAMNNIMFRFHCCGITSIHDFSNLTFYEKQNGHSSIKYTFPVAPACCSSHVYNDGGDNQTPYLRIKDCALHGQGEPANLNNKGCYDAMFETFQGLMAGVLIVILVWNIICLVLAIMTILEIKPEGEIRPSPSKEAAAERRAAEKEKEEREIAVKKFIPYAKISSFVHPDITRIKSTEIW